MKNVIAFTARGSRYAIELRWVREVVTLGFVTPVPGAPDAVAGVVSVHGTVTPVIELAVALGGNRTEGEDRELSVRRGDGAIVIEVDNVAAAIHVASVDEVSTLWEAETPGALLDSFGREVASVDCPALLHQVLAATTSTREPAEIGDESSG